MDNLKINFKKKRSVTNFQKKTFNRRTCSVDGAFLTSLQRPLDQDHCVVHVVGSTHGGAAHPRRLLQQPQDVCGIQRVPPDAVEAPVLCGEIR